MEPLVIVATPNISWLHPEVPYPHTPAEIAEEAALCHANGAAVLHLHAEGQWQGTFEAVRAKCNIILQGGMSSLPIPDRMEIYSAKADMISIILNHHDEAFARTECNVLHRKDELEEYSRLCSKHHVRPEFEVWHSGSIWNLNYLIQKRLVRPPFATTLFFGWPGGTWSPPTVDEYLHRRQQLPDGSICAVSIMGPEQVRILTAAIVQGDHIRVGTEDNPFSRSQSIASCHELVKEAADIARSVGRPIATVAQARVILGLRRGTND